MFDFLLTSFPADDHDDDDDDATAKRSKLAIPVVVWGATEPLNYRVFALRKSDAAKKVVQHEKVVEKDFGLHCLPNSGRGSQTNGGFFEKKNANFTQLS